MSDTELWDSILAGEPEAAPPPKETPDTPEPVPESVSPPEGEQQNPKWDFVVHAIGDWPHEQEALLTDDEFHECLKVSPTSWMLPGDGMEPTDENIARIGRAYVGKRHPVPVRKKGGDWHAQDRKLMKADFERHLDGGWLLGAYLLDENDMTGVAICDIDAAAGPFRDGMVAGDWDTIMAMCVYTRIIACRMSVALGVGVHATLTGGKGAHVVVALPQRAPSAIIRRQLHWMCVWMGLVRSGLQWAHSSGDFFVECFPKQDEAGKGLGNLIRLPNGVDPGTGRHSVVITDDLTLTHDRTMQPMYRVVPAGASERSRREIQAAVDSGDLGWMQAFMGEKYEVQLQERCEALIGSGKGPQMANAVGQAIHMAAWWDPMMATGLVSELEIIKDARA